MGGCSRDDHKLTNPIKALPALNTLTASCFSSLVYGAAEASEVAVDVWTSDKNSQNVGEWSWKRETQTNKLTKDGEIGQMNGQINNNRGHLEDEAASIEKDGTITPHVQLADNGQQGNPERGV